VPSGGAPVIDSREATVDRRRARRLDAARPNAVPARDLLDQ